MLTRRRFLAASAAIATLPRPGLAAAPVLRAAPSAQQIAPEGYPSTDLWTFDGTMPGRALRYRQGDRLALRVSNDLAQPTAVHWHGLRLDNAMDGVPGLTQDAIAPGGRFDYAFDLPDAGTYWYHSHARTVEQMERGLYGPLVIDETDPPDIDRDLTLVLDDIRLGQDAQLTPDFDNRHDRSHAGRIGNLWLCNGAMDPAYPVSRGERLRLRLVSAANARVFELGLPGLAGWIVALDGMPLARPEAIPERIVLAPAQRADLIVDVTAEESEAFLVTFERDGGYVIATFPVSGPASARRDAPAPLPPNPDFPIDLADARSVPLLMEGGAMGGMSGALYRGARLDMRALAMQNVFWAFNGTVGDMEHHAHGEPLITVSRGESVRIGIANDTAFSHAMHLHGMHFAEVLADGSLGPLRDTLLVHPHDTREIAFNAHNPGDWLFHCHMLSHHEAGMGTFIRVT